MPVTDRKVARKFLDIEKSAQERGITFNMSLKKVRSLLNTKKCYFTGRPLNNVNHHADQLTFDRIDNSKGYIDSNVVACSYAFNLLKGNLTVEQIVLMYEGLKKKKIVSNVKARKPRVKKDKLETPNIPDTQSVNS